MRTLPKNTYVYQVMQWLNTGRSITPKQAIEELGCTRLAAVIPLSRRDTACQSLPENLS